MNEVVQSSVNHPHCQLREEGLALELFEDQSDVIRLSLVISDLDWFVCF